MGAGILLFVLLYPFTKIESGIILKKLSKSVGDSTYNSEKRAAEAPTALMIDPWLG